MTFICSKQDLKNKTYFDNRVIDKKVKHRMLKEKF